MGCGYVQLVAQGVQDIYLTGDPGITHFKTLFRRHTSFSMEAIPQTSSANFGNGNKVSVTIGRYGDLLGDTWVEFQTQPTAVTSDGVTADGCWIAERAFSKVELLIGENVIDCHYQLWWRLWSEVFLDQGHKRNWANMTSCKTTVGGSVILPLLFFFCRHPGLFLPLIALQNHMVRLDFHCTNSYSTFFTGNPTVWSNYVFLDAPERLWFAKNRHEYLIEQTQRSTLSDLRGITGPVKELIWCYQNPDAANLDSMWNFTSDRANITCVPEMSSVFAPMNTATFIGGDKGNIFFSDGTIILQYVTHEGIAYVTGSMNGGLQYGNRELDHSPYQVIATTFASSMKNGFFIAINLTTLVCVFSKILTGQPFLNPGDTISYNCPQTNLLDVRKLSNESTVITIAGTQHFEHLNSNIAISNNFFNTEFCTRLRQYTKQEFTFSYIFRYSSDGTPLHGCVSSLQRSIGDYPFQVQTIKTDSVGNFIIAGSAHTDHDIKFFPVDKFGNLGDEFVFGYPTGHSLNHGMLDETGHGTGTFDYVFKLAPDLVTVSAFTIITSGYPAIQQVLVDSDDKYYTCGTWYLVEGRNVHVYDVNRDQPINWTFTNDSYGDRRAIIVKIAGNDVEGGYVEGGWYVRGGDFYSAALSTQNRLIICGGINQPELTIIDVEASEAAISQLSGFGYNHDTFFIYDFRTNNFWSDSVNDVSWTTAGNTGAALCVVDDVNIYLVCITQDFRWTTSYTTIIGINLQTNFFFYNIDLFNCTRPNHCSYENILTYDGEKLDCSVYNSVGTWYWSEPTPITDAFSFTIDLTGLPPIQPTATVYNDMLFSTGTVIHRSTISNSVMYVVGTMVGGLSYCAGPGPFNATHFPYNAVSNNSTYNSTTNGFFIAIDLNSYNWKFSRVFMADGINGSNSLGITLDVVVSGYFVSVSGIMYNQGCRMATDNGTTCTNIEYTFPGTFNCNSSFMARFQTFGTPFGAPLNGLLIWSNVYGSTDDAYFNNVSISSFDVDSYGNYIITGNYDTYGDSAQRGVIFVKVNATGIWGSELLFNGHSYGVSYNYRFVAKMTARFDPVWALQLSGSPPVRGLWIANVLYICGTNCTSIFNVNTNSNDTFCSTHSDAAGGGFVLKIDGGGNIQQCWSFYSDENLTAFFVFQPIITDLKISADEVLIVTGRHTYPLKIVSFTSTHTGNIFTSPITMPGGDSSAAFVCGIDMNTDAIQFGVTHIAKMVVIDGFPNEIYNINIDEVVIMSSSSITIHGSATGSVVCWNWNGSRIYTYTAIPDKNCSFINGFTIGTGVDSNLQLFYDNDYSTRPLGFYGTTNTTINCNLNDGIGFFYDNLVHEYLGYGTSEATFAEIRISAYIPTLGATSYPNISNIQNVVSSHYSNWIEEGLPMPGIPVAPLGDFQLQMNGQDRFAPQTGKYFSQYQPFMYHSGSPYPGIYVYSFAVDPEDEKPSGSCNFSRVSNPMIVSNLKAATDYIQNMFAVSYNVLRIESGMGGLAFAN